ncbi:MAG: Kef-type K(+) transport system [Candidatus Methanohalarchaeum thermophilum]|uniref:Kef-type K(+) transport system n=1 Tax=Methanohalarchaeum thermophilum TaxID=1903181 RepID=A0A1Q6DT34_METT1|nr:MAG: Kef-type K(+) transport system [Candidatus Methanohalarchaeum thermophilum]
MALDSALLEIGLMFTALAGGGVLSRYLKKSVIPFYILLGITLGPYALGRSSFIYVGETEITSVFLEVGAELGVIFLLFFLGLEFSFEKLLSGKKTILKAGFIDLFNLVIGFAVGFLFFGGLLAAALIGGIVYISSSAIITRSLIDLEWIANDEAESILGILVFEDLFIAIYLALITAFLLEGTGNLSNVVYSIVIAVAFILFLLASVHWGSGFFERILDISSNEMLLIRATGVTILVSGLALSFGVSAAVAAFFIGMAFGDTENSNRLEEILEPIRDLFAAVFFFYIGSQTDPSLLPAVAVLISGATLATGISKLFTGYFGGKIYGLNKRRRIRVGLSLTTRGEFSLVIATIAASATGAMANSTITETIPAFTVGYVLVMSILGTLLMQYSSKIETKI